jgi:hypothetical protein
MHLRERYAVATAQDVSVWCIRHEHEYTKLRGGHTRAVVALHACSGETVGLALAAVCMYSSISAWVFVVCKLGSGRFMHSMDYVSVSSFPLCL